MHDVKEKKVIEKIIPIIIVTAIIIIVLGYTYTKAGGWTHAEVNSLSEGWYYVKDGEKIEVRLPMDVPKTSDGTFELYNDSLTSEHAGKVITTKGAQYNLAVSMNGHELYKYSDTLFPRNAQMKAKQDCDAILPVEIDDGTLVLTYQEDQNGKYECSEVWIGNGNEVMMYHLREQLPTFLVAFLFGILGVIAIGIAIYLHFQSSDGSRFVNTALFLLICGVWLVTDSPMVQQYGKHAAIVCIISFYAFMLLAVPMLHFVKNIKNMKRYRVIDALIMAFYANAVIQGILNTCFEIPFIDMLFVTHMLLTIGVFVAVVLMIRESRNSKEHDVRMVLVAFVTVSASGILALALYWLFEISFYTTIFQTGILIFIILIIANVIISMAENLQYRTELLTYQRLAREDWMTGLGNRLPFDEFLDSLEQEHIEYNNIGLIFLDVNHLKWTNDQYGHAAGDEIIIGASKCIVNVFGGAGKCYRIGGDEFGVILTDPEKNPDEWFRELDEEIEKYNQNHQYYLSVARGWSSLYGTDGQKKTISDWKFEADLRMYENKKKELKH